MFYNPRSLPLINILLLKTKCALNLSYLNNIVSVIYWAQLVCAQIFVMSNICLDRTSHIPSPYES